ncbi:uncharacterized protein LOC133304147 [Gastrolobium bilobum]|uniref:uncharacterized protein LOC133304147 n=1 Tax=Gastrolobium bilobum TaxID=150636 RepID=UPI002AB23D08|nr:uncharacterized protein LOC133304147 [Gastrolobium bilobum]
MSWRRFLLHLPLLVILLFLPCLTEAYDVRAPSSCGNILNISHPFWLESDPQNCGEPEYQLHCVNNQTILNLYNGKYIVQAINYNKSTIRVTDSGVIKDDCSSIPQYTLTYHNFTNIGQPYSLLSGSNPDVIAFMSCTAEVISPIYMDTASCIKGFNSSNSSLISSTKYTYAVLGDLTISELKDSCSIIVMAMTSNIDSGDQDLSYGNIHQQLVVATCSFPSSLSLE